MVNCYKKVIQIIIIFLCLSTVHVNDTSSEPEGETLLKDFMICRHCGSDISLSNFLIKQISPVALASSNVTLFNTAGVLVQDLANQVGAKYKVVLVKKAICGKVENWSSSFTWFPGYAWKICVCPKCSIHLGWMYEPIETATTSQAFPSEKGFYALTLSSVLSETYVNSLLMTDWVK